MDWAEMQFATRRLSVRNTRRTRDHAELAAELAGLLSPVVTTFLPPHLQVQNALADGARWLVLAEREGEVLTLRDKSGALFGLMLLGLPDPARVMLGYLLAETGWGQGFATELVSGFVAHLREAGWTGTVIGGMDPQNIASARVLSKAGFRPLSGVAQDGAVYYATEVRADG